MCCPTPIQGTENIKQLHYLCLNAKHVVHTVASTHIRYLHDMQLQKERRLT